MKPVTAICRSFGPLYCCLAGTVLAGVLILVPCWRYLGPLRPSLVADIVSGQVVDEHGPVAGAIVRFPGGTPSVCTDDQGCFALVRPAQAVRRLSAYKPGYFIAGAPTEGHHIRVELRPHPVSDSEDYQWLAPWPDPASEWNCGNCHREIYGEWLTSAHARAATNPYFLSLCDGTDWSGREQAGWNLMAEYPDGAGVCAACHAPAVRPDDPASLDPRLLRGTAAQGVHCDFCHKVLEASADATGLTHGRFGLTLLRPREGRLFFGPLDDVVGNDTYAPVYRDSRYCAPCHEGLMFGVRVYGTYSEWLQSPAGRRGEHCQSCHMTPTGQMSNMAPEHGGIPRDPASLASHREPAPREEMLRRCLLVQTQLEPTHAACRVTVTVSLQGVGHRLPTGFIDRQLILTVEAQDADGQLLQRQAGPTLPGIVGSWQGRPGRLYAKQPCGADGHSPVPSWRALPDPPDTRLHPDRADRVEFLFPRETQRVRVRLVYRRFWEEVTRTKRWPSTDILVVDRVVSVREP